MPRNFKRDDRLDLEILSDLDLGVSLSFGLARRSTASSTTVEALGAEAIE